MTRGRVAPAREITLVDLATHTSGLPCWPNNLGPHGPDGPFARYSLRQLYEYLSTRSLERKPGVRFEYSNLGMGLLGEALARRAGSSYDSLVKSLLCEPLGLRDTSVVVTDVQRLASGPDLVFASLAGAGALHSTANDLLRFLAANLLDPPPALAAAIKLSHGPRPLGWMVQPDGQTYYHDGATAGYTSWMSFHRARRAGVVVLQNRGQSP